MTDHHTTLELVQHDGRPSLQLVRHDETARAPERDYDATAFELDASCLAPEVLPDTAPQVLYRKSLPEVNGIVDTSSEVPVVRDAPKPTLKWLWLLMALVVVAAVAIGVGVGVWYTRRKGSSGISQPIASSAPDSPTVHTPTNASTAQYILNDTSLAAVVLPNNDRHLYFQDSTGRIRYVILTATTNQWSTSPDSNIGSSAKNHTPLAVTAFRPDGPVKIELFYVSQNHQLSSSITNGSMSSWQNDDSLTKYTTAPDTRSLSVISNLQAISNITDTTNDDLSQVTTTMAVLFYESPNASVAVLSRNAEECSECPYDVEENPVFTGDLRNSSWIDNTPTFRQQCANSGLPRPGCNAPFASSQQTGGINFSVKTFFDEGLEVTSTFVKGVYTRENLDTWFYSWQGKYMIPMQQTDMAWILNNDEQYLIWINNNKLEISDIEMTVPKNTFPFVRLASATTLDNQTTYLYHQMNGTTFAEESFQASVGDWTDTSYINVTPPP